MRFFLKNFAKHQEGRTAEEILTEYPALTVEEKQEILAAIVTS